MIPQEDADRAIELALEHGVNHIDVAPHYGEAKERLAPWMPRIRDKVFLASKTTERSKDDAWGKIHECLRRMGVDSFDLFQLHGVTSLQQLDAATGPGGALEALIEMRDQGLTKWIGITGHGPEAPRVQLEALRRFDFDTIMFPLTASIYRDPDYLRDAEELLAVAASNDVGIQTIKMLARGEWGDREADYRTGYDPHREQEDIDKALWWLFSQPVHTAPSAGDERLLARVLDAAERFTPLSAAEQQEVVRTLRPPLPGPEHGNVPAT